MLAVAKGLKDLTNNDVIHPFDFSKQSSCSNDVVKISGYDTLISNRTKIKRIRPNEIIDTLQWVAPEILTKRKHNVLSNIYSFGLLAYFVLTGELPFKDTNPNSLVWSVKNSTPVPVSNLNPAVPITLENLIRRLLHKEPSSRIQTFEEIIKRLEKSLTELGNKSSISIATGLMINRGRLIGKHKELSSVVGDEIRNSSGNTILLSGEKGSGKTRFLQDVMNNSRDIDIEILSISCVPSMKSKSWSGLGQIIEEIIEDRGVGVIGRSKFKDIFSIIYSEFSSRSI
ncbi:MAG: protein kinase [Caldisericia bacterium]